MAYATITDVRNEILEESLIEITDDPDNPLGVVDEAKVVSAIARADAIIDGYIGRVVEVPLATPTATVTVFSVDIAIYTLFTRLETIPERRKERYQAAIRFLEQAAAGEVGIGALVVPDGEDPPNWPVFYTAEKDFDDEVIAKF